MNTMILDLIRFLNETKNHKTSIDAIANHLFNLGHIPTEPNGSLYLLTLKNYLYKLKSGKYIQYHRMNKIKFKQPIPEDLNINHF